MKFKKAIAAFVTLGALSACDVNDQGQYTTGKVKPAEAAAAPVVPGAVQIFEGAPERAFTPVKALEVTVNKLTAFHPNPTREAALAELRKEAAKLGADAVINVTVSDVKVVPLSWGARTASGTAVKF